METEEQRQRRYKVRKAHWERLFDMGYHGHLEGNRERWVNAKLALEGF